MDMPEKLWDLANLVTGFAVVQSLALIYGLVKDEFKLLKSRAAHWSAVLGTVFFSTVYVLIVWYCGRSARSLSISVDERHIWRRVNCGRVGTIVVFTIITVGTISIHWRDAGDKAAKGALTKESPSTPDEQLDVEI